MYMFSLCSLQACAGLGVCVSALVRILLEIPGCRPLTSPHLVAARARSSCSLSKPPRAPENAPLRLGSERLALALVRAKQSSCPRWCTLVSPAGPCLAQAATKTEDLLLQLLDVVPHRRSITRLCVGRLLRVRRPRSVTLGAGEAGRLALLARVPITAAHKVPPRDAPHLAHEALGQLLRLSAG